MPRICLECGSSETYRWEWSAFGYDLICSVCGVIVESVNYEKRETFVTQVSVDQKAKEIICNIPNGAAAKLGDVTGYVRAAAVHA